MKTPNVQRIEDHLLASFPGARAGGWLCRRIAGSLTWSQHAYDDGEHFGNASDIFPVSKAQGDLIVAFLRAHYPEAIKTILWQVKNHFDHIHYDTWPTGYGTPPCKGGSLRVRHRDGSIGREFTDDLAPIGEARMFPIDPTSEKEDIRLLQDRLNQTYGAGLVEDGVYGPTTEAAVRLFLGKMTGDPDAAAGKRVVANQWNGMLIDLIKRYAGSGGLQRGDSVRLV